MRGIEGIFSNTFILCSVNCSVYVHNSYSWNCDAKLFNLNILYGIAYLKEFNISGCELFIIGAKTETNHWFSQSHIQGFCWKLITCKFSHLLTRWLSMYRKELLFITNWKLIFSRRISGRQRLIKNHPWYDFQLKRFSGYLFFSLPSQYTKRSREWRSNFLFQD